MKEQKIFKKVVINQEELDKCGSTENLEFHHLDYNSPDNFMIFCRNCHLEEYENGNWEKERNKVS